MREQLYSSCAIGGSITSLCSLFFNIITIATYFRMKKTEKENVPNILLLNQAFADLLSVIPSILWYVYLYFSLVKGNNLSSLHNYAWILLMYTSFVVVMSLSVITFNRFIYVQFPLFYPKSIEKRAVLTTIVLMWIISLIPAGIYGFLARTPKDEYTIIEALFSILLFLVLVIIGKIAIVFYTTRSQIHQRFLDKCSNWNWSNEDREETSEQYRKERRFMYGLLCKTIVFSLTIPPHIILMLICLHLDELQLHKSLMNWLSLTYLVYTLYAVVNPLLTIFSKDDFSPAKRWITFGLSRKSKRESEDEVEICEILAQTSSYV